MNINKLLAMVYKREQVHLLRFQDPCRTFRKEVFNSIG